MRTLLNILDHLGKARVTPKVPERMEDNRFKLVQPYQLGALENSMESPSVLISTPRGATLQSQENAARTGSMYASRKGVRNQ
jgi:hypothetical protein